MTRRRLVLVLLPAVLVATLAGLFTYSVSAARAAVIVKCEFFAVQRYSPGLTPVLTQGIQATVEEGDGQLTACTGDPAVTAGSFSGQGKAASGLLGGASCLGGTFDSDARVPQRVTWQTSSGEQASDYDWKMVSVADLLKTDKPIAGRITSGRYKNATYLILLTGLAGLSPATCASPTGLRQLAFSGILTIVQP